MIAFITWLWGDKYTEADVLKLYAGVKRNTRQPFRFLLMTERERELRGIPKLPEFERHAIKDPELTQHKGCFARLRMFDPGWQKNRGLTPDDRLVSLDLDDLIVGDCDGVFDRSEPFVILQKVNALNPCPYCGALMMLRPGAHPEVWTEFSLERARHVPFHEFPDDQGWLHAMVPHAAGWRPNDGYGVFAFSKPGWPDWPRHTNNALPQTAKIVCFTGWRKPSKFQNVEWVRQHWRYP